MMFWSNHALMESYYNQTTRSATFQTMFLIGGLGRGGSCWRFRETPIRPKISPMDLLRVMTFDGIERGGHRRKKTMKRERVAKSCQRSMCHSRRSLQLLSVVPLPLLLHLADLSPPSVPPCNRHPNFSSASTTTEEKTGNV